MQRDGCSCFSQVIEFKSKIPEISLVKATEYCIFDYLDFEKMCKDRDRLISLLNAKFENFSDYSKMQMVYDVIMVRNKKCNLFSLKLFIILTELDSVPLNQVGNLCVDATSYFEFIYKVSIMILDSKRN